MVRIYTAISSFCLIIFKKSIDQTAYL